MTAYGCPVTADGADAADGHRARGSSEAVDSLVDWEFAARTAARLVRPGPTVSRDEAHTAVEQLRAFATEATAHVSATTGLHAPAGEGVLVVDRAGWATANVDAFRTLLAPAVARAAERRDRQPNAVAAAIGSRVTGAEVGSLLAFLASRVLGQYDVFGEADTAADGTVAGRLLLVAPNVLQAEREMDVDARDFRMWVCLHEETHRVQFTAVPWMRDHIHEEIGNLIGSVEMDSARLVGMFGEGVKRLSDLVRGDDDVSLLDLVHTPEQKVVLDRITAVMSLLEGHADVVMDGVGPEVIPSVAEIRRKFNVRRKGAGSFDRILRKLLGLDAKMAQYRNGAAFVRGAVDRVGMEGFNKVWVVPENLPSKAEIGDPDSWVRRVHG